MIAVSGIGVRHVITQHVLTPPGVLTTKNGEASLTSSPTIVSFPKRFIIAGLCARAIPFEVVNETQDAALNKVELSAALVQGKAINAL